MLVNAIKILNNAKEGGYAIPQFNINGLEWTRYILEESEELKSPVILGVSEGAAKYIGGYKTVFNMVSGLLDDLNITVPVVLHLDHSSSLKSCIKAIDNGFTSVMIDASNQEIEENINVTGEVVLYARERKVSVEGEMGSIGGAEDEIKGEVSYAKVDDCIRLSTETGLDLLAPALGSVHGLYKGKPKLDFIKMKKIKDKTGKPLVLHGGTGIPDDMIKKAIESGVAKININTELQIVWAKEVRKHLNENKDSIDPRKIISAGKDAIKKVVKNKILLFNSNNKA